MADNVKQHSSIKALEDEIAHMRGVIEKVRLRISSDLEELQERQDLLKQYRRDVSEMEDGLRILKAAFNEKAVKVEY